MKKMRNINIIIIFSLILLYTQSPQGFSNYEIPKTVKYNLPEANAIVTVTKDVYPFDFYYTPTISKSFIGFREAVGFKESRGKYHITNTLGYLGKYQFGRTTLQRFKIYNTQEFLKDPELQEKAFIALLSLNKYKLRNYIKKNVGRKINGIEITESGILAAAHLAGAGSVKKYLRSNGQEIFSDAYGTNVQHYMKRFSGFDTSFIKPDKDPTIII